MNAVSYRIETAIIRPQTQTIFRASLVRRSCRQSVALIAVGDVNRGSN